MGPHVLLVQNFLNQALHMWSKNYYVALELPNGRCANRNCFLFQVELLQELVFHSVRRCLTSAERPTALGHHGRRALWEEVERPRIQTLLHYT